MTYRDTILAEITAWCERTGTTPTALGKLAVNDPAFVSRLRAGKMTISRLDRVRQYMLDHPPRSDAA